jgi:hypothetical protein
LDISSTPRRFVLNYQNERRASNNMDRTFRTEGKNSQTF